MEETMTRKCKRRKPRPARPRNDKNSKCKCLKCEELFNPIGKYNRICDKCKAVNEGYKEVATSYNITVGYSDY